MRKRNSPSFRTALQRIFFKGPLENGASDRSRKRGLGFCRLVLLIFVFFLGGRIYRHYAQEATPPHTSESTSEQKTPTPSIKVDVDLVLINATVTDPSNRFVTGLEKEHFQVFEDKVEQKITEFSNEDVPTSIGRVI